MDIRKTIQEILWASFAAASIVGINIVSIGKRCLLSTQCQEEMPMGYRKVGALEQCWYIIRFWVGEQCKKIKNKMKAKIKSIFERRN